ncbi:MAG: histidine phosphatase family protein [Candidatus Roizmanbacteria bacterium]
MTTIYFVRHGEYKNFDIVANRLKGFPLSNEGRKQIEKIAVFFKGKNIKAIFSSPLLRTKQTAGILNKKINLKIRISNLINEVDSPFKGSTRKYVLEEIKNVYKNSFYIEHNGETMISIYNRMKKFVNKVLKNYKNKRIIAVSHGDPIMIFLMRERKLKFNGDYSIFKKGKMEYIPPGGVVEINYNNKTIIGIKPLNWIF